MLLAMRKSSRPFDDCFCLKSPTAAKLLRQRVELDASLGTLKNALESHLYELYERFYDQVEKRKAVLRLKRDVQNERRPHPSSLAVLAGERLDDVRRYEAVLNARERIFPSGEEAVRRETRHAVETLARDGLFQRAIAYAAPELRRKLAAFQGEGKTHLTEKLNRGLYAYTAKWMCKANPLNYFAGLSFPRSAAASIRGDIAEVEFQVDVGYLLALERRLLEEHPTEDDYGLLICPHQVEAEQVVFLLGEAHAVRLLMLARNPLLEAICDYFRQDSGISLGDLLNHLSALGCDPTAARAYSGLLLREGILKFFLIEDFLDFESSVAARTPGACALFEDLARFHGRTFALGGREWEQASQKLNARAALPAEVKHPVHLNLYFPMVSPPVSSRALEPILKNLRRLKPLLTGYYCFSNRAGILRKALAPLLEKGASRAGYMACLVHLLRHQNTLESLQANHPDLHPLRELSLLEGELSVADLDDLIARHGTAGADAALNCNGVYDYQTGCFAISNLWDGDGHYLSRYRPRECPRAKREQPADRHLVQIYDTLGSNKNLVGVVSDYGFSLDRRYRRLFTQWLEPGDIQLESRGDRISYRHLRTGKPIEFFWRGFVLITGLPVPYQLLLLNNADAFYSPFAYRLPPTGSRFRDALSFGKIILRRGFWSFLKGDFPTRRPKESLLDFTYRLGCYVRAQTGETCAYYFYRIAAGENGHKPFFLDITNCQSVAYLLNILKKHADDAPVTLEKMMPSPEGLHRDRGKSYMAELLLEV